MKAWYFPNGKNGSGKTELMSTIKDLVPSSRNSEDDDGDGHTNNCNGEIKANTLQISTEYYVNTEWGPTTQICRSQ